MATHSIKCHCGATKSSISYILTDTFDNLTSRLSDFSLRIKSSRSISSGKINSHHHNAHHTKYGHSDHEFNQGECRCGMNIFHIKLDFYFCQSVIMLLASYSRYQLLSLIRTRASIIHHWFFHSGSGASGFLTSIPFTISGDTIIYEANCVPVHIMPGPECIYLHVVSNRSRVLFHFSSSVVNKLALSILMSLSGLFCIDPLVLST